MKRYITLTYIINLLIHYFEQILTNFYALFF